MRALALSTMETNAAATCGPCCAAAECFRLKAEATGSMINRQGIVDFLRGCDGCFRLKAEATRQTRLRGLGSRRAPREIVTSEQTMRAPDPLDANACGGDVRSCCAAAACFRLKAEATGSMINRQGIVDRLRAAAACFRL